MLKTSQHDGIIRFDLARTLLGQGYYWTAVYYFDGLLIDSGCVHSAFELTKKLDNESVKFIVNTHSHEDHIGANCLLQNRHKGLEIYTHPLALPVLSDPKNTQPLHFYNSFMWGYPKPSNAIKIIEGSTISTKHYNLEVIYTPGHSIDHICLYEPEKRWLFTGDLFIGGKDKALRLDYNIWQIINSLKKVSSLPIKILFPGGARVRKKPSEELESKILYLEELGEKILKLYNQGQSVKSIIKTLF